MSYHRYYIEQGVTEWLTDASLLVSVKALLQSKVFGWMIIQVLSDLACVSSSREWRKKFITQKSTHVWHNNSITPNKFLYQAKISYNNNDNRYYIGHYIDMFIRH